MKISHSLKTSSLTVALSLVSCFGFTAVATAAARPATASNQQLSSIKTNGDQLIAKRLTALKKATDKVAAMQKLQPASKTALQAEIASTTSGLTQLKTKLDADTTVATAKADRNLIMTDYRVYALVIPKVHIVKVADDQLVNESRMANFALVLQQHTPTQNADAFNAKLTDMKAKLSAAQKLSQDTESAVLALKPSDYNANHKLLVSQLANLKKARDLNKTAWADGKAAMKLVK